MKHDKLIAEDEMPTPSENVENEEMKVDEVISVLLYIGLPSRC